MQRPPNSGQLQHQWACRDQNQTLVTLPRWGGLPQFLYLSVFTRNSSHSNRFTQMNSSGHHKDPMMQGKLRH